MVEWQTDQHLINPSRQPVEREAAGKRGIMTNVYTKFSWTNGTAMVAGNVCPDGYTLYATNGREVKFAGDSKTYFAPVGSTIVLPEQNMKFVVPSGDDVVHLPMSEHAEMPDGSFPI